jgi:hypothetical protein
MTRLGGLPRRAENGKAFGNAKDNPRTTRDVVHSLSDGYRWQLHAWEAAMTAYISKVAR